MIIAKRILFIIAGIIAIYGMIAVNGQSTTDFLIGYLVKEGFRYVLLSGGLALIACGIPSNKDK